MEINVEICLGWVARHSVEMQRASELERSPVVDELDARIRSTVLDHHTDLEALHRSGDRVIIRLHIRFLVLRKKLKEIAHVHKGHV